VSAPQVAALRLEREFDAPPEEVFDAWTNPEVLTRWWAPTPSWDSPGCEVDLRVGGRYRLTMREGEGAQIHAVAGEYREIDRPRRLVYTWCWEAGSGMDPGLVTLVTVDFIALGDRTRVVLEHAGLGSEESRTRHGAGWQGAMDNLRDRIFGDQASG
jgi:glutathione S-transferase